MSGLNTIRMLEVYRPGAPVTSFLTGFFNPVFHNSEKVEVDIEREGEEVAIVVQDISAGYRKNSANLFTNKEFTPPVFKEEAPLNSFELIKRQPGDDPFKDPDFQATAIFKSFSTFRKLDRKIRRSIELQASQVLQTGTVTLVDAEGNELYVITYDPKASHFPTSAVAWDAVGDDKIGDLTALANQIRTDGLVDSKRLLFGETAFLSFINDDAVQKLLDNRRIEVGQIAPAPRGNGATLQGSIKLGNYNYEIWTYNGRYEDPQTGDSTPFLDPGKVVMLPDNPRFDGAFGTIPRIVAPDERLLPFLPASLGNNDVDLQTNAWLSKDNETLHVALSSRPLLIPVGIDTYGCLDTQL